MGKYILKRILIAIPVLIGITIIDYVIMCIAGSPLEMLQGPRVSEAAVEAKAIAMGLDQPIYVQYFVWLEQLFHGNSLRSIFVFIGLSARSTAYFRVTSWPAAYLRIASASRELILPSALTSALAVLILTS